MRRALEHFPVREIAEQILSTYFIPGGKAPDQPYKRSPLFAVNSSLALLRLTVAASFVEVFLAKEGHRGLVGFNLLEKIQMPNLACLYGAMLADVDYVIMGAGIPREIPGALDKLSKHQIANLKVSLDNADEDAVMTFDPVAVMGKEMPGELKRPYFFPIVSSAILAASLKKKSTGEVNGFIVEGPVAGGHNAPPRGPMKLNSLGEPIYGVRDEVSLADMKELGLPFWMAGAAATPEKLEEYISQGAHGIQVGTLFAFCQESGLGQSEKQAVIDRILSGDSPENGWVFTDPVSSPTGFPFKAVRLSGTMSETNVYQTRRRICDLGYLRSAYKTPEGGVGYRCAAEPVEDFIKKGGTIEQTVGKKCLCNALMADIGMPQIQKWKDQTTSTELPLLTAGDDLNLLSRILNGRTSYKAADVIHYIFSKHQL
jgi:NAD(P)H-dependent flavin oxidoreductase YrpB (nitropropane dioxygenase family)